MARRIWGRRHGDNGKHQMGRLQQTLALLAVLAAGVAAAALLGGSSYAYNLVSGGTTDTNLSFLSASPTISSDKDDYNPGNTVTLTGRNWAADESVHILVNDNVGQTWSYETDVTADGSGNFTVQFQLPMTFIATYQVTATGATSGTATASFTDGNLTLHLSTSEGVTSMSVPYQSFGKNNADDITCSGTGSTPGGSPKTVTAGGTANIGVQSFESVRLGAVTSAPPGFVFDRWTTGTSTTDSGNTVSGSPTPCIGGVSGGTNGNVTDLYAHFRPANHAPAIARANATVTVDEGQTANNNGTWSDADSGDTVTLSASVGTVTKSGTNASGTWSWSFNTTDGPAQGQTVTITANDGHGGTAQTTFALTVNNVAPTAAITGAPANSPEGTAISLGSNVTDPSSVDAAADFTRNWSVTKNGNPFASGSGASLNFTPNDNGTYVVSLSATDKDGGTGNDSKTITVTNVNPTATITGAPTSSPEGTAISLGSTVTDPSSVDTAAGFTRSWSVTKNGNPFGSSGSGTGFSFTPDDNGTYVVTFSATDKDGGTGTDSKTINVTNVAPNVTGAADQTAVEGSSATFTLGSFTDPGASDNPWAVDVNWGDGSSHSTLTKAATGSLGSESHTYDDSGSYTVTVTVTDKDGDPGTATFQVSVGNVAPTATFSNNGPVNEGSPVTVSFSAPHDPSNADTAAGFHYAYSCSGADLSSATYGGAGSNATSQCTFNDNGTYTVSGVILDKDGGFTTYTATVTVNNVNPTVTPGGGSATEGVSNSFSLGSFSDPGTDDDPWKVHVDWGDSTSSDLPDFSTQGSLGMAPHTYADNGSFTVKVKVTDKDGGSGESTFTVNVLNAPPFVSAPADQTADEGSSTSFSLGSFTDSGVDDDPWSVAVNWGDGSSDTYSRGTQGAIGAESHTFDDGPHVYTVTVTVTDKDGGSGQAQFHVTVANVKPTASLGNDGPTDEGSNATISFSGQHDPSSADTAATFHYTYACDGNAASLASTYATALMGASATCTFPDGPASHPVLARIFDKDNGYTQYSTTVDVHNAPPDATSPADQSAYEGTSTSFDLGTFTDPGVMDAPWKVYIQWGDGSPSEFGADRTAIGSLGSPSHTYADNGTYTVSVNVMDKDHDSDTITFHVTVANVPPLVVGPADQSSDEGQNKSFDLGSFTDKGVNDGPWSVDVNWGDGSPHTTFSSASQGALGSRTHTYADNGNYTVTVTVTDKDGGSGSATFHVAVANRAPQLTAGADQSATEGTSRSFSLGSFSDAGANDNPWTVEVNWGDGSPHTTFSLGSQGALGSQSHTYADNGLYTATVTVTDKDGGSDSDSFAVTVANANPIVTAAANQTATEGTGASFGLGSFSDPGANDAPWSVDVDWGDGSAHTTFTAGAQGSLGSKPHTYGDNGDYTVAVTVTDKDGGTGSATFHILVANANPVVTAVSDQTASEGTSASFPLGSFSDAGVNDGPWGVSVNWGDGSAPSTSMQGSQGSLGSMSHTYADSGSFMVTVTVTDKDGGSGSASFHVNVANAAPIVTAAADQSAAEGTSTSFSLGSFSDAGVNDHPWAVDVNWGDGSAHTTFSLAAQGSLGSQSHTYDDNATNTVTVTVTDKDGSSGSASFQVTVANVNPTATLSNNGPVAEGSPATVSFSAQHDPSGADTAAGFHYSYACDGQASSLATTYGTAAMGSSTTCSFPDGPSSHTVKGRIFDKDGGYSTYDTTVIVNNANPIVTAPADQSANEGATTSFSIGSFSDAGVNDNPWAVDVNWGDGSAHTTFSLAAQGAIGSQSHTYADNGAYTVTVKVTDKDGGSGQATFTITVSNANPSVTVPADQTANEGAGTTFSLGSFSDAGANDSPWGVDVNWGDGSPHTTFNLNSQGSLGSQSHTYADNALAPYTVIVKVTDKDNGSGQATFKVAVSNVPPTITAFSGDASLSGPLVFYPATFNGTFTDPGKVDNPWVATWSWDGVADPSATQNYGANLTTSHDFSQTHQYTTASCNHTATVKITDKDGGYDTKTTTVGVGTGAFLPPMTNQPVTNKLRNGQVLPVKIQITDCSGAPVNGLTPAIRLIEGDQTTIPDDSAVQITPPSVSNADTNGQMRSNGSDGSYIYNMNVTLARLNTDYTVVIYPYWTSGTASGPTLKHVIQATK
jgi:PKD repeat protein